MCFPNEISKRGAAVEHAFRDPVDIEETGRFRSLTEAQDALLDYSASVSGPVLCYLVLMMAFAIPISKIAVGYWYKDSCPAKVHIPMYLIIAGITSISYITMRLITSSKQRRFLTIFLLFSIVWLITGSKWIFSIYKPNYVNEAGNSYCDEHFYMYAVWITITEYILIVVGIIYLCIICQLS